MSSKKIIVTIKDIADKAGVSFSTVGKALHNSPLVNKETKKRIQKIAKELNYYPNLLAKGLKDKKTKTIGVVLNDLKNPVYSDVIEAMEDTLNKLDYTMLLCDSYFQQDLERKNIITMLSKGVDGIIISPINEESENLKIIIDNNLKVVFLDCIPDLTDINYVYVDHKKAAFLATEYLIKMGHKNILLLNGPKNLSSATYFLKGYLQALSHYSIKPVKNLIKYIDISIDNGCNIFKEIYRNTADNKFTAIVTLSDLIAIGIYKASKEIGLKIPHDYSIIGYDNIFTAEYLNPPLTTIHLPKIRTGVNSIEILIDQINNKYYNPKKIVLEPRLVERESVMKIDR